MKLLGLSSYSYTAEKNTKPIIIIQGDHGYRYLADADLKDQKIEAHSIFSYYLLPNNINIQLNDSIRPTCAFSLLFNER